MFNILAVNGQQEMATYFHKITPNWKLKITITILKTKFLFYYGQHTYRVLEL